MNRVLRIIILTIIMIISFMTVTNAVSTEELLNHIKKTYIVAGEEVKLPNSDYVKVERYFSKYPVDEQTADEIIAGIDQVIELMNQEGVSNPYKLKNAKKKEVFDIAQQIAKSTGATLTYDTKNKSITIYKNGQIEDVLYLGSDSSTFRATGNNEMLIMINITAVIIALTTAVVYRKIKNSDKQK